MYEKDQKQINKKTTAFSSYEKGFQSDYKNHEALSIDFTVNDVLSTGINNLKERIELLKAMMHEREYIKNKVVKQINEERNRLTSGLLNECSSYNVWSSPGLVSRKTSLETHIARLESDKGKEEIQCFKDLLDLNRELQYARELYSKERMKKKIVDG